MEFNGGQNYTLTVRNIREKDLGNYSCNAVNKVGEGIALISLSGIPHAIQVLSSSNGRHRTIYNLTWTLKSFALLEETEILYKKTVKQSQWTSHTLRSPVLSYWDDGIGSADDLDSSSAYDEDTAARRRRLERRRRNRHGSRYHRGVAEGDYVLEDLSPNTEYEVKIRAKNRFGWSQDEGEFVFTTSDRDPSPQKMATYPNSSTGLRDPQVLIMLLLITASIVSHGQSGQN